MTSAAPQAAIRRHRGCLHCLTLAQRLAALLGVAGVLLASERAGVWATAPVFGTTSADGVGGAEGPAKLKGMQQKDKGITQNLYVQGHLAFWDKLRRRNPGLRIDSCASGGRRNDLETMRRPVPLLRSDLQWPNMEAVIKGQPGAAVIVYNRVR